MKTVLLTGAAGFIGAQTAMELLDQGYKVVGLDNLNDYYDPKLKNYRVEKLKQISNFEFFEIDIENLASLESLFEKYQFSSILNLAARAGVRYSIENPHIYLSTNAQGSLNLLECAKKFKVKKFLLASTSSLYAGEKMPFVESLEVNHPISPYAASKKAAEAMAYTYHHLYDIDVSIVRYFTVYGNGSRPDMAQFRFMRWIDDKTTIELFGDGTQARDFTHVTDIAKGTVKALKNVGFEVFNLGGGNNPIAVNTMIELLENHLGQKAKIDYKEFHNADMKQTWANIDKAKQMLNWSPQVSFEDGIKMCVNDYLNNKEFYQNIKLD